MPSKSREKRRIERVRNEQLVRVTPCTNGKLGRPLNVAMRDFSPRGIGIWHSQEIPAGTQVMLSLEPRNGVASHLMYEVVRVEGPLVGGYAIGAEFVCVISDTQLKDLRAGRASLQAEGSKIPGTVLS